MREIPFANFIILEKEFSRGYKYYKKFRGDKEFEELLYSKCDRYGNCEKLQVKSSSRLHFVEYNNELFVGCNNIIYKYYIFERSLESMNGILRGNGVTISGKRYNDGDIDLMGFKTIVEIKNDIFHFISASGNHFMFTYNDNEDIFMPIAVKGKTLNMKDVIIGDEYIFVKKDKDKEYARGILDGHDLVVETKYKYSLINVYETFSKNPFKYYIGSNFIDNYKLLATL